MSSIENRENGFNHIRELSAGNLLSDFFEYANDRTLLTFLCKCNVSYKTTSLLYESDHRERQCPSCNAISNNNTTPREIYIQSCQAKYGTYYDYGLLPEDFAESNNIVLLCPAHGNVMVSAESHLKTGAGCEHCKIDNVSSRTRSAKSEFVTAANTLHDFKYRYDDIQYVDNNSPITISCAKHGHFTQTPTLHLRGIGCSICMNTSTKIADILKQLKFNNLEYSTDKTFAGCNSVDGRALRFDIYVPQKNICIEFDGIHHYQPTKFSPDVDDSTASDYFTIQQENDQIKSTYCKDQHINLIRIPYTEFHPEATSLKYLLELPDVRYMYTWHDLNHDVKNIINYIKTFNYSDFAVYGISRGGLPFMVSVTNHFDDSCEFGIIRFQRYDGNDKTPIIEVNHNTATLPIFLIDDLISSGETMKKAVATLTEKFPGVDIHPIVIFGEENDQNIMYVNQHPKQWILFPYEL